MSKGERERTRERIRQEMKRERARELRNAKIKKSLLITVPILLVIGLVVLVVNLSGSSNEDKDFVLGDTSEEITAPQDNTDKPYLEFGAESDKPVMDLYLDFTCPFCKDSYEADQEVITEAVASENITLRVHPRTFLDRATQTDYSSRAAIAMTAVYEDDPQAAMQYISLLFENQPSEGGKGLSNDELQELADEAGSSVNTTEAIHDGAYRVWLQDTVEVEAAANTQGTPYILIDGQHFEDWRDSEGLRRELGLN